MSLTFNRANRPNGPYSLNSFLGFVNQNFAVILIVAIGFGVGFLSGSLWTENNVLKSGAGRVATAPSAAAAPAAPAEPQLIGQAPAVEADENIRGKKDAAITLIEYSDFECPFCARFHPAMKQVMEEYGDKVRWVYRHYPLSFHPNAQKAAEASECVAKMGGNDAFWKYADAIFAENDKLGGKISPEAITAAIQASGANATTVQTCVDSGEMADLVKNQMQAGTSIGVTGTPGTVLVKSNGDQQLISGAVTFEQLKAYIDAS